MMVETYLLRGKRRLERLGEIPGLRPAGLALSYGLTGCLLSAAAVWGIMQPIAMGFTLGSPGWWRLFAALGSGLGYRLFWGQAGMQGALWVLGALIAGGLLPFFGNQASLRRRQTAAAACIVSAVGLAFQYGFGDETRVLPFFLRICVGAGSTVLWLQAREDRILQWLAAGTSVLALTRLPVPLFCNPGLMAAGAMAAAAPLPAAVLAGFCADLAARTEVSITGICCLAFFLQKLPLRERYRRMLSPAAACCCILILERRPDWRVLCAVSVGGTAGAMLPWRLTAVPRHGAVGAAQVQLEQCAQVLTRLQHQLLEYSPPEPDTGAILEQLRQNSCGKCTLASSCADRERVNGELLHGAAVLTCRKAGLLNQELRICRDQLKRLTAARAARESCRAALAQQYAFLGDMLRALSDRLPEREYSGRAAYRVLVSSRSQGKELADGDRVTAFAGPGQRFYVLLCDGMGTGLGASAEGYQAGNLMRQMLTAGIPPASAMGTLNSQLALLGRGGAVTVDLAEIRLDSGIAWVYKWGADASWILSRGRREKLGYATPPPGLDVKEPRGLCTRADLSRGQVLILVSDGIRMERVPDAAALEALEPGEMAERILQTGGSREDDATAVVVKLAGNG